MNSHTRNRFTTEILNDPFFVGFDKMFDRMHTMNRVNSSASNYPPYNLIQTGDDTYIIELAVAGFDEDDFDVEIHDSILTIKADIGVTEDSTNYLHKGIAARNFERKFTLADTIKVAGASLKSGMLTIKLENVIPEDRKPKKIEIGSQLDAQLLTE